MASAAVSNTLSRENNNTIIAMDEQEVEEKEEEQFTDVTSLFAPLGGNRPDCAIVVCAAITAHAASVAVSISSHCCHSNKSIESASREEATGEEVVGDGSQDTNNDGALFFFLRCLPGDVVDVALAALCAPVIINTVEDVRALLAARDAAAARTSAVPALAPAPPTTKNVHQKTQNKEDEEPNPSSTLLPPPPPFWGMTPSSAAIKCVDSSSSGSGTACHSQQQLLTVTKLWAGGPAHKAGLRRGDVITAVNGVPVHGDNEACRSELNKATRFFVDGVGSEEADQRQRNKAHVVITIVKYSSTHGGDGNDQNEVVEENEVSMTPMTIDRAYRSHPIYGAFFYDKTQHYQLPLIKKKKKNDSDKDNATAASFLVVEPYVGMTLSKKTGAVTRVVEGGPTHRAGITIGDYILSVNHVDVDPANSGSVLAQVKQLLVGEPQPITISRRVAATAEDKEQKDVDAGGGGGQDVVAVEQQEVRVQQQQRHQLTIVPMTTDTEFAPFPKLYFEKGNTSSGDTNTATPATNSHEQNDTKKNKLGTTRQQNQSCSHASWSFTAVTQASCRLRSARLKPSAARAAAATTTNFCAKKADVDDDDNRKKGNNNDDDVDGLLSDDEAFDDDDDRVTTSGSDDGDGDDDEDEDENMLVFREWLEQYQKTRLVLELEPPPAPLIPPSSLSLINSPTTADPEAGLNPEQQQKHYGAAGKGTKKPPRRRPTTSLPDDFLSEVNSLTEVDMRPSVHFLSRIGSFAFAECEHLTTVHLPKSAWVRRSDSSCPLLSASSPSLSSSASASEIVGTDTDGDDKDDDATAAPNAGDHHKSFHLNDDDDDTMDTIKARHPQFECSGLETIADFFLAGCLRLTRLDFAPISTLVAIGDFFLCGCRQLAVIDLGNNHGLQVVGDYFAERCAGLRSVVFPSDIQEIGEDGFLAGCGRATVTYRRRPSSSLPTEKKNKNNNNGSEIKTQKKKKKNKDQGDGVQIRHRQQDLSSSNSSPTVAVVQNAITRRRNEAAVCIQQLWRTCFIKKLFREGRLWQYLEQEFNKKKEKKKNEEQERIMMRNRYYTKKKKKVENRYFSTVAVGLTGLGSNVGSQVGSQVGSRVGS